MPIACPNNKRLKHGNVKKDRGSNYQKVGEKIQDKGFGAKNDSSISSASHCGIVKIMSL